MGKNYIFDFIWFLVLNGIFDEVSFDVLILSQIRKNPSQSKDCFNTSKKKSCLSTKN
jgi:hypothetical protein